MYVPLVWGCIKSKWYVRIATLFPVWCGIVYKIWAISGFYWHNVRTRMWLSSWYYCTLKILNCWTVLPSNWMVKLTTGPLRCALSWISIWWWIVRFAVSSTVIVGFPGHMVSGISAWWHVKNTVNYSWPRSLCELKTEIVFQFAKKKSSQISRKSLARWCDFQKFRGWRPCFGSTSHPETRTIPQAISTWDWRCPKWHEDVLFPEYFVVTLSVSFAVVLYSFIISPI
jgi:hypothetical protein